MNERRYRCWALMTDRLGVSATPSQRFDVVLPSGDVVLMHLTDRIDDKNLNRVDRLQREPDSREVRAS